MVGGAAAGVAQEAVEELGLEAARRLAAGAAPEDLVTPMPMRRNKHSMESEPPVVNAMCGILPSAAYAAVALGSYRVNWRSTNRWPPGSDKTRNAWALRGRVTGITR